jgi:signal peptidase I
MADPDIVCCQEADHAILFNPDTSTMQGINAVGYLIWQALARPRTPSEIVAHLVATCEDVPAEQVGDDVEAFLQALRPGGFVGQVLDGDEQFYGAPPARQASPVESALSHATGDEDRASFYHGNSMLGTFRPGDRLIAEPVPITAIRPGDVVVYRGREELGQPERIVHRVVAVTPGELVTQGDNSPYVDAEPVHPDTLLSRVTHVERDGRVRRVWGGRWGLLRARALHAWWVGHRLGWRLLRIMGRRAYRRLREGGLVRRLWRPAATRIRVEAEDGPLVKYVHRGRTVAWWWPKTESFRWHRPYDLVIPRPDRRHPLE